MDVLWGPDWSVSTAMCPLRFGPPIDQPEGMKATRHYQTPVQLENRGEISTRGPRVTART